ncbi:MAG: non-ribosomal peptide synthetase, partial [Candidatus Methylomirabilis sp.]
ELILKIAYDPNRFEDAPIARLLGHAKTLLEGMYANRHQRLSALPLLTDAERHQVLVEWNATRAEYPQDRCIHELFEEQVDCSPAAAAVIFEKQQLTYQELNARANQLAHYLRKRGVGPETLVAICTDRSLEMVVGVLGILKAGGAYVPLDPTYPRERLAFMLEDTQARVLLTQRRLVAELPEHRAAVICLDTDWPSISRESQQTVTRMTTAAHLAYVIYTSGTTGKPKGVMVEHANLCHYVHALRLSVDIADNDVYLHTASIAFSSSVRQLMLPLSRGAAVVIASSERLGDPVSLFEMIKLAKVSVIDIVPSYWRNCADALVRLAPESRARLLDNELRLILSASEVLWSDVPRNWTFGFGHTARLVNMFGQTETTGIVSVFPIPRKDEAGLEVVPIGRPIANTEIYLLDQQLRPVPAGVAGEVYIGGRGVGRGYLNRPDLTAEKFIPDTVGGKPGARLYKTGDMARYQPTGDIEFLGRSDNQLKIRGHRVEPGEIESVLGQHVAVRESVVLAREDVPGDKRLIAYVVVDGRQAPSTGELHSLLKEKLPGYMVPSAFVLLDGLPLTPNGKVDRGALPMPDPMRPELERRYVAPRDTLERQLAKIWERVLRVQPVGVRDNFFDLGGHSLLAVRLFSQIENFTGKTLPLVTLFQAPTVEQLAAILRQEGWSPPWSSLVAIQPGGSRPPFYCVHGAGGNVVGYRDLGRLLAPDQPVYGLQSQGLDGKHPPHTRVEDMAAQYIQEIRAFQPEGPYFLGGLSSGGLIAFEMAQQLHTQSQRVALLALFDTYNTGYEASLRAAIGFLGRRIRFQIGNLLRLGPNYFRQRKRTVLRKIRGRIWRVKYRFYEGVRRPLPRALQNVYEANGLAARQYAPQVYAGRVTLFRASDRGLERFYEPLLGWGGLAAGGVEVHVIQGGHTTMVSEPHVRALADELRTCLRKSQAEEPADRPAAEALTKA